MAELPAISRSLLAYTMWADRQFLDALREVPDEHLTLATGSSFGSLLATIAHVLGSEQVWLSRFLGAPLERFPDESDWADLTSVRAGFQELWAEMGFFLASLSEDQLLAEIAWTSRAGDSYRRPLWEALVHMSHHSTYHRGQLTTMLRQLGYAAPSTDLIAWYASR